LPSAKVGPQARHQFPAIDETAEDIVGAQVESAAAIQARIRPVHDHQGIRRGRATARQPAQDIHRAQSLGQKHDVR
jgi:hypothetical protein